MSAIVVHAKSLSLTTLPPLGGSGAQTLSLPSRFPGGVSPRSASAAEGNTFIWGTGPTVWEYDGRGRRVGELSTGGSAVDAVAGYERGVAVAAGSEVVLFRRSGSGRAVGGKVACMDAGAGVLAVCVDGGVAAYALESGVRLDMPSLETEANVVRVLSAAGMPAIFVPSAAGVTRVSLAGGMEDIPLPLSRVRDIAVRGERVCVGGGSMLAFLRDGAADIVDLDLTSGEVHGVTWLTSRSVAAWTTDGAVVLVDADSHELTPIKLGGDVLALHPVQPVAARRAVSERPALAETNTNANANGKRQGKEVGFDKRAVSAPVAPAAAPASPRPAPRRERDRARQTSDTNPPPPAYAASTARFRPPSEAFTPSTSAPTPSVRGGLVAGLQHVPEWDEGEEAGAPAVAAPGTHSLEVEALRREIANLQMDMLRMGRGLKNEIRATVAPLVDELRANRDTIAAQAAEIERLRRGY